MSWWPWGGSEQSRIFNVLIYEEDYKQLCAWVLKKPNIETGGNLFGLWADKHTAVIQLALGPGKDCRRTSVSFYQDVDYLERVGSYLTQNEGVCHIGEWHSHHQLGLAKPSDGEKTENTVWNNMPTYNLKRFVIFIANIQSSELSYKVNIGCFLFETDEQGNRLDVLPGEFTILQKENPFSGKVAVEKKKGAEKDDENKIAAEDLELEVKAEGKSPCVTYMKRFPPKRPKEAARRFEVVIYEEDYKALCAWVLKKPNIETGGDLFGLWADKYTAVIQLVLGPGKDCRRTSTSFYQDIDYLQRVGSYLTRNEGVCHIGEWHSHHQLGLARPSGGDENTVWNNMPTYNLKRFVIFIANIRSSWQHYKVNIGCFLFEIDGHGNQLAVLPGDFTILQKENLFSLKQEVSKERNKDTEIDDENKITVKDLKLKVKGGRHLQPSVTYYKPSPTQSKKRNREKKNQQQAENQDANKADDEERCGESKKPKMDTGASYLTTAARSPGGRSSFSSGSLVGEDEQPDEQPELHMDMDEKKEQPEKKEEEETMEDDNDKNLHAKNKNQDQQTVKERSEGEENKDEIMKIDANREARSSEGDQGKPENKSGDNESQPRQRARPLPKLEEERTPSEQTGRQSLDVNKKESAAQGGRPLPKLEEETTPTEQTGSQTLEVNKKESAAQEGGPLPKLEEETTPSGQTEQQTLQVEETVNTKDNQSKGNATQGGRPLPKLEEETTPTEQTGSQTLEVNKKESAAQEGRPLPKLEEETTPSGQTEQQKTLQVEETVNTKDNQSKGNATQGGRPLPKLEEETTPTEQTGSQTLEVNKKESAAQEGRPLQKLEEETTPSGQTEQQKTLQVEETVNTKDNQSKGNATQEGRPLPLLKEETTPTEQTGQEAQQVDEKVKTKDNQSKENATQEGRPLPQLKEKMTTAEQTGQQAVQVHENVKTKDNQSKGNATQEGRPLPQLKEETTPAGQTERQTQRVDEKAKTKDKKSKGNATQEGRPLPQLKEETTPPGQTGQQTHQVDKNAKTKANQSTKSAAQGGGPKPKLGQETTFAGQRRRQTLQVDENAKTKANQRTKSAAQGGGPKPKLGQETTSAQQTGRRGEAVRETEQVKGKAKTQVDQSAGSASQGGTTAAAGQGKTPANTIEKKLKIEVKAVKTTKQRSSDEKAGSSGTRRRKDNKPK